jgi:putative membrane protein
MSMKDRRIGIYGVATTVGALLLAPAAAQAQAMSAKEYVTAAGASDLYERESSKIVLSSTSNPKLREFAQMMVAHHTNSTEEVKAAAKASGLKPMPPKLTPAQSEMIAQLNSETGTARDSAYIAQQKMAHNQALAVQQAYAREGTAKPLRDAAGKIVPVVEQHITMLKSM